MKKLMVILILCVAVVIIGFSSINYFTIDDVDINDNKIKYIQNNCNSVVNHYDIKETLYNYENSKCFDNVYTAFMEDNN